MGSIKISRVVLCVCLFCATSIFANAFVGPLAVRNSAEDGRCYRNGAGFRSCAASCNPTILSLFGNDNTDDEHVQSSTSDNKFDIAQRIESLKSVVLGAVSGGIAVTPIAYVHYVLTSDIANTAQWEFVTDMSSLQAALFAIVYRYAVRANDNNPMLNQGVVGAFVVVRTLSNIQVTDTCQSVPLRCKLAF